MLYNGVVYSWVDWVCGLELVPATPWANVSTVSPVPASLFSLCFVIALSCPPIWFLSLLPLTAVMLDRLHWFSVCLPHPSVEPQPLQVFAQTPFTFRVHAWLKAVLMFPLKQGLLTQISCWQRKNNRRLFDTLLVILLKAKSNVCWCQSCFLMNCRYFNWSHVWS